MEKIIMIGPVYPYKGGISHYAGLMYRALSKKYDVRVISYKMQYPKLLFRKEQRDYKNDTLKVENADFLINTANPFNYVKVARYIKMINPELVIFQWWHPYFSPCYWGITKLLKKQKKLFICHNVFPHERFPLDKWLVKKVLCQGNYFIVHSSKDEGDLKKITNKPKVVKTVIPTFDSFNMHNMSKSMARDILEIQKNEKVLLFFGFVREYKGLKYLIQALPQIVEQLDGIRLLIVGDFGENRQDYIDLIRDNSMESYIDIYEGYIPDDEVEKFFVASDVVVLPYETATQSGIVQVAYSFEKPVIATNVGGLPEVVIDGKTGYIVESKNSKQLAEAVVRFYSNKDDSFTEMIRSESYKYSWDRMVEIISNIMKN